MAWDRVIAWSGWILALISFPITVMQFAETRQSPQISYSISQKDVLRTERSDVSLNIDGETFGAKRPLNEMLVTVWNSGNVSFKSDEVRRPVRIRIPEKSVVLRPSINDIRSFDKDNIVANFNPKWIDVSWKILDSKNGLQFSFLTDSSRSDVDVTANIGPTVQLLDSDKWRSRADRPFYTQAITVSFFIFFISVFACGFLLNPLLIKWEEKLSAKYPQKWAGIAFTILLAPNLVGTILPFAITFIWMFWALRSPIVYGW